MPAAGTKFLGLGELAQGMVLAAFRQRTDRPCLVVLNSPATARNIVDNYLFFAGPAEKSRVHYLPNVDFDFYRGLLPNPETLCERNVGLHHALNDPNRRLFVTTLPSFLQKAVPPAEFARATRKITAGEEVDRDELVRALIESGYQKQPTAFDPGIFAVRGAVIDIFCPLYPQPLRLEFFGDTVDEIRFFEADSQRSLEKIEQIAIIPVGQSLIPHGDDYAEAALKIKERLDHQDVPKSDRDELLERIRSGVLPSELSFLFPLLSRGSASIAEFFPHDTLLFWEGSDSTLEAARETELPKLFTNHRLFEKQPLPIAAKESLFVAYEELEKRVASGYHFERFESTGGVDALKLSVFDVSLERAREAAKQKAGSGSHASLDGFASTFSEWIDRGYGIHIACHTRTHAERLQMLLEPYNMAAVVHGEGLAVFPSLFEKDFRKLHLWQGFISQGQVYPELKSVVFSEEEIFGRKKRTNRVPTRSGSKTAKDPNRMMAGFRDLKVGDFVVHKDHGIGRYLGLKSMGFLGVDNDYVLLEYKDGDKLYIPIYRLNVLQKYVAGEGAGPVLDKLGGDRWLKAKGKAQRAVAELAADLLKLQARRKLVPAEAMPEPNADYRQFEMEFPFDETPDQMKAIDDVMDDLGKPHPMDRLVCGDVGYGKTEVAMRASYRAVLGGKQVALLVPTTVLAFQHGESFRNRFKNTGVRIEMVSRMRSSAEVRQVIAEAKEGKVDVLIGTHRLLSSDVQFKRLGLIVIDEEHRFGVSHKEKLKKLSESVHVLSLTATPIPRTLNMAMTGIKEISLITTPPPDRLSVRTFVCRSSPEVIAEAVTNELGRGGQVYFVHNRIESLFKIAEEVQSLLPKVKIEVAHGQMDGDVLEKKMLSFYRGEAQMLLCTSIIESGLDIPRANTIIIDRADTFGLAALYQLRGRVGRSEKRAYCYLLVPGENLITADAKERLQVIQRYTDLGSGFGVASHDLEIRGAGDLLGKDQSGHLAAIGIDLYFELLEDSIRAMRGEEQRIDIEPEINMKIAASFPNAYLPDISERIQLYRKLSGIEAEEEVEEIESEIRDRFGTPPEEVINLLGLMKMKLWLKRLHVLRMSCGPKRTSLQFADSTPASPAKLVALVQSAPKRYALTPDQKLVFTVDDTDWRNQLKEVQQIAMRLGVEE